MTFHEKYVKLWESSGGLDFISFFEGGMIVQQIVVVQKRRRNSRLSTKTITMPVHTDKSAWEKRAAANARTAKALAEQLFTSKKR